MFKNVRVLLYFYFYCLFSLFSLFYQVIPFFDVFFNATIQEIKNKNDALKTSPTIGFKKFQKCENFLKIAKINNLKVGIFFLFLLLFIHFSILDFFEIVR